MGFMDSIKDMFKGKKTEVNSGIDKGANVVTDKVGSGHADQVDKGAAAAKDQADKLTD